MKLRTFRRRQLAHMQYGLSPLWAIEKRLKWMKDNPLSAEALEAWSKAIFRQAEKDRKYTKMYIDLAASEADKVVLTEVIVDGKSMLRAPDGTILRGPENIGAFRLVTRDALAHGIGVARETPTGLEHVTFSDVIGINDLDGEEHF